MKYCDALKYIHSKERFGSILGLERIEKVLKILNNPQDKLSFVHVAGTNGKGSTCAITASILKEAGCKTGLYISPFIEDFRERIQIDGEMVSKRVLAAAVKLVKDAELTINIELTEFEFVTVCAFVCFLKYKCDIVVLEVGLGGRFDATNVIKSPKVCAITSISLDHTEILGDIIEKIAFEKCGIVKDGAKVVSYPYQDEKALKVIRDICSERKSELILPCEKYEILEYSLEGSKFLYENKEYFCPLVGEHQVLNAILAINIVKMLGVDYKSIFDGMKNTVWPCRFEIIDDFILDGGHNPSGIDTVTENIKRLCGEKKIITIMAVSKDKDINYLISNIAKVSDVFIATRYNNERSMVIEEILRIAEKYCKNCCAENNIKKAVNVALKKKNTNSIILICGSLFIAGEARGIIKKIV